MTGMSKSMRFLALSGAAATLAACATAETTTRGTVATADLISSAGAPAGSAVLVRDGRSLVLRVTAQGLTPGEHGLHLHTVGRCDPPKFTTAEEHWNPTGRQHGPANPAGPHAGDMPNLIADASGRGSVEVTLNDQASQAGLASLFDEDGTALVIHAGPDDMRTDPSGKSGDRVSCGVLVRS